MTGKDQLLEIASSLLKHSAADQTEVLLASSESALTRFANNFIHQNVSMANTAAVVRAVVGRRIGVCRTNDLSPTGRKAAVEAALQMARLQRDNPDFRSLPRPQPITAVNAFSEATANCTPEDRAARVRAEIEIAKKQSCVASGALSTSQSEAVVVNSLGIEAYHRGTLAELKTVVMAEGGSGYAMAKATNVDEIDVGPLAETAVEKALQSRNPIGLPPGEYTVVLEPYAVGDIAAFLGYLAFGALTVQEGRSYICGKLGRKIFGENITLWDDGLDPAGLPTPFDAEGVPKQKVMLIDRGVAQEVVYDSLTGGKEGRGSTGHARPAGSTTGPAPGNLFLAPGESSLEEMVASTARGIYVTRFHYTNVSEPTQAVITGMTRDGTFLIEDGQITQPVKNFRFTQSLPQALNHVESLSQDVRLGGDFGGACVPALKISRFRFTGTTDF